MIKKFTSIEEVYDLRVEDVFKPQIAVIGVGGAGTNAVNNMINMGLLGVKFVVINTDSQSLENSECPNRIQIGVKVTKGLGAGSRPELGIQAAEESSEDIKAILEGINMLFITCGMGGGTGTGASQVVAKIAKDMGILTVAFVTKPFDFEGSQRLDISVLGINELEKFVDSLVVISNQSLFKIVDSKTSMLDAFRATDTVLFSGVKAVTDLLVSSGLVNLDFNDIRSVIENMGRTMIGVAEAEGPDRAERVAKEAIFNPLLEDGSIVGAKKALINITGGQDMTLFEVDEIINIIKNELSEEAFINFGTIYEDGMGSKVRVSVVATGLDPNAREERKPYQKVEKVASISVTEARVTSKVKDTFDTLSIRRSNKEKSKVVSHQNTKDNIFGKYTSSVDFIVEDDVNDLPYKNPTDDVLNNIAYSKDSELSKSNEVEDQLAEDNDKITDIKVIKDNSVEENEDEFFEENKKVDLFELIARKNKYDEDAKKINSLTETEIINIKNRDKIKQKQNKEESDITFFDLPSFLKRKD